MNLKRWWDGDPKCDTIGLRGISGLCTLGRA